MITNEIHILIADDDEDILEILQYTISKAGYQVHVAHDGREACKKAKKIKPHLILLDVMMPLVDGFEACQIIRKESDLDNVIIVFLTARGDDFSEISGFDAGADDYIVKPIRPNVLLARLESLLRRRATSVSTPVQRIEFDDMIISPEKHSVIFAKHEIFLPKKEFLLLHFLASNPQKVFSRQHIYAQVWGDTVVGERTIDVHIRKLREKLHNQCIKTIKGVGYYFEL